MSLVTSKKMLKHQFESAKNAAREAFKVALDNDYNENTLSELWRHYQGLNRIWKDAPDDTPQIQFQQDTSDMIGAAGPVPIYGGAGSDVISFGDVDLGLD